MMRCDAREVDSMQPLNLAARARASLIVWRALPSIRRPHFLGSAHLSARALSKMMTSELASTSILARGLAKQTPCARARTIICPFSSRTSRQDCEIVSRGRALSPRIWTHKSGNWSAQAGGVAMWRRRSVAQKLPQTEAKCGRCVNRDDSTLEVN